ncbi:hypothetical protein FRB99_005362 [Tulasnella sp. 403]|nr:hypothetical protein FRB99_005362 [Tulasnella sp. 403]
MDQDLSKELRRALGEQEFGIKSYTIQETPYECGVVELLEGRTIQVRVSERGWEVVEDRPTAIPLGLPRPPKCHETLDNLLRSHSPMYAEKEAERLREKLNTLLERE